MRNITRSDFLQGVRHWVQWSRYTASYEVFRYFGHEKDKGLFWFQSVPHKDFVAKSFYQLGQYGFVPFCLDTNRLRQLHKEK